MRVWRKIRGLLGVGATWGVLWGGIGAAIGFLIGIVRPEAWIMENPVVVWGIGMGLYGVVSGVGFGGLLSLREGSKTLRDLSLRRVALWGVLGSAAVPLLFLGMYDAGTTLADIVGSILVTGAMGGVFAPGSVAIARRAELGGAEEQTLLNAP